MSYDVLLPTDSPADLEECESIWNHVGWPGNASTLKGWAPAPVGPVCDLLQQKDIHQSQLEDKVHGKKSGGNQAQVSKGPFQEDMLVSPARSKTTHVKGCVSRNLIRDPGPRVSTEG